MELLVVILIIGIVSTVALFAFGDFGQSARLKNTAEQFHSYLQFLEEMAVLKTRSFAVYLTPTGYETYQLSNDGQYKSLKEGALFRPHTFPNGIFVILQQKNKNKAPQIVVDSAGFLNPFKIGFGIDNNKALIELISTAKGEVYLETLSH